MAGKIPLHLACFPKSGIIYCVLNLRAILRKIMKNESKSRGPAAARRCKIDVDIYGQTYPLAANSETEYLMQLAQDVDQRMRKVADENAHLGPMRVAILAMLDMAAEVKQLEAAINMKEQNLSNRVQDIEEELELLLGVA